MRKSNFPLGPAFHAAVDQLRDNPGQWGFFESVGNCLLVAGPGSGKTRALTVKLAQVLYDDVRQPQRIACITYSNECARELSRRIESLGIHEHEQVFVGTVHSFALQHIIRPFAQFTEADVPENFQVAPEQDRVECLGHAVSSILNRRLTNKFKTEFQRFRITSGTAAVSMTTPQRLAEVVQQYERNLRERGLIDTDDMVLRAAEIVEHNEWVRRLIVSKFPILFIDEYQDLGVPLHRLVLALLNDGVLRLLAVGDPDQGIYGFVGARPNLMSELGERQDIAVLNLDFNYRCGQRIVAASEAALGQERGYRSKTTHVGSIYEHHRPDGLEDQAEFICQVLLPEAIAREKGRRPGDIAILYADKFAGDVIAAAAARRYPIQRLDRGGPYPKNQTTRWVEDCAAWCSGGWAAAAPRLRTLLRYWRALPGRALEPDVARTRELAFVEFLWNHRSGELLLRNWLREFSEACLRSAFRGKTRQEDREAIVKLMTATADGNPLHRVTVREFGGMRGSPTHLNLITLHSAKGLEFDVVVIVGMDQGGIPSLHEESGQEDWFEARRKFYVGLTRAKREVHLTYSGFVENYDGRVEKGPSEFLLEVRHRLEELDRAA
jgi:DNA helicase-2/ATP-dependent DNA helicase PcrA